MTAPQRPLGQTEFVALIAMLFATIAFSIDAMLPALPQIAAELTPAAPNRAQLIITSFVLGMGIGTFFAGPLSDSFGRKPMMVAGAALYCLGAAAAWAAPSLETVLVARLVQGLGAAGPRVVSLAMVRDLYQGRQMARVVSFAMMVFTLVPAVAPLVGSWIMAGTGWRGIFAAFLVFSLISMLWLQLRQPETLPSERRRPLAAGPLRAALVEVMSRRVIVLAIAVQALCFGALFATLSSTQQIFDVTFGRAAEFPLWFALIALVAGTSSLLNAVLVVRLGMRRLVTVTLAVQAVVSFAMAVGAHAGTWPPGLAFPVYLAWTIGVFFMAGMTMGNLTALALEPVGHIAGMAASAVGAIATVAGAALAIPLGLAFDGTLVPLAAGVAALAGSGLLLMLRMPPPAAA
ncbi:MAG: multidrug effflux MFS transporter [Paracoccaceae bacterium]|nr:MAG: multidrug effflux MFS transporter [Paracoccaceae bacterium]